MGLRRGWEDAEQLLDWFCRIVFSSKHFLLQPNVLFKQQVMPNPLHLERGLLFCWAGAHTPWQNNFWYLWTPVEPQFCLWKSWQPPPPPPPTSPEKGVDSQVSISAPNPPKLCLWIRLKRIDSFPLFFVLNVQALVSGTLVMTNSVSTWSNRPAQETVALLKKKGGFGWKRHWRDHPAGLERTKSGNIG